MYEDTKGVIMKPYMEKGQWAKRKESMIHEALHRKVKIEKHEHHKKQGVNSCTQEEWIVPVSLLDPSCYKPDDNMRKWYDSDQDKQNISVVICDTGIL